MNYPNGTDTFGEYFKSVPSTVKATVGAIILFVALGIYLADFRDLPDQVEVNRQGIVDLRRFDGRLERALEDQDEQLTRILCHLEEARSNSPRWERCEQ